MELNKEIKVRKAWSTPINIANIKRIEGNSDKDMSQWHKVYLTII